MTKQYSEVLGEFGENVSHNKIANVGQKHRNGIAYDRFRRSVCENWQKREMGFGVNFRTRFKVPFLNAGNYLATFDPAPDRLDSGDMSATFRSKEIYEPFNRRGADYKRAMLAPVIDCLQFPEQSSLRLLPAMIRLYALNEANDIRIDAGQFASHLIFESLGATANGEADEIFRTFRAGFSQFECHMIQGGPELMRTFRSEDRASLGEGFDITHPNDGIPLIVYLTREGIQVSFKMCLAFALERFNVFPRPVEFTPEIGN